MLSLANSGPFAVAGIFGIGLVVGLIVLTTAEDSLMAVAKAAVRDISASFWVGLLWQALAVPLLAVLVIGCVLTIIGILAIPIVVLAWALAYAGAFTLGLLAVALVIGRALVGRGSGTGVRAAALRGLVVGLFALSLVWLGASLLASVPVAGVLSRLIALSFTWAVATVGLGAVVTSRGGIAKIRMETTMTEIATPSWQTPTPVQGVVAARRPVASSASSNPTSGEL
ncbi:MAG: hypothetical protein IPP90_19200 [Gemmatimonadaceae bacterium]|nr:hypothetical protein [Gemmatimonadaceae bacterium]